jgi:hypothetical protein
VPGRADQSDRRAGCVRRARPGEPAKLRVRQRHEREPSLPHEWRVRKVAIGLDLGERHGPVERADGGDLDDEQLRVAGLRIGISRLRHPRETNDGFLVSGVVDERVIARLHRGEMLERDGIAHAIPDGGLLAREVVPAVGGRFGLQEPVCGHRGRYARCRKSLALSLVRSRR